jgi:hypothetical protein
MNYTPGDCLWDAKPTYWYTVYRRRKWMPWSQWQFIGHAYTNPQQAQSDVDEMNRTCSWWHYKVEYETLLTYPDGTIDMVQQKMLD